MASLFDDIFQSSGKSPANSLFSSKNTYKATRAGADASFAKPADAAQEAVLPVKAAGLSSPAKEAKAGKNRQATETANPQDSSQQSHKRSKALADNRKGQAASKSEPSLKRKATAPPQEPHAKQQKQTTDSAKATLQASSAAPDSRIHDDVTEPVSGDDAATMQDMGKRLSPEEEAEKLRRTVFVGNLPSNAKKKMLQKEFSQYGSIESIRKRSVPVKLDAKMSRKAAIITGNISESRGTIHAYVVFHDEPAALAALASNMHLVGGLHIRVDRAGQSAHGSAGGSVMYERNRTLFIGNLPFDIEDEEIITFFNENCTKLGIPDPVDAVRVVRDSASQLGKGFGFVQFNDQAAARAALGCDGQLLKKRAIRVTKAVKVPAHLKDLGQAKTGKKVTKKDASERKPTVGPKQGRPSTKAVGALQRKAEPAENWQGFKTKGSKKTVAAAVTKSSGSGQRPVEGKRKAPEKRPSVIMRKQRSLGK